MRNITPVIVHTSLNVVRGGLTKAILTRANMLVSEFDKVYIFTLLYQQNHEKIISNLYKNGLLDERVKVLNFFEDVKPNTKKKKKKDSSKVKEKEKGLIKFKDKNQSLPSYRYYKNGLYVLYKRYDEDGNLLFINYMDEGRYKIKKEEFNDKGRLVRARHMDKSLNTSRLDRYFDDAGKCFMTIWVNPETKKEERVNYFGEKPKEYKAIEDIQKLWVNEKLDEIKNPIIMTDTPKTGEFSALKINGKVKKVCVVHNNHFKKPYDGTNGLKANYKSLFKNIAEFNRVVFLTDEQKNDIEELYGKENSLFVIPHPAKQVNQSLEKKVLQEYNPNLAVTLARYDVPKRLDEAIKAFKFVVDKIPLAEYHIYGFGKEEKNLNQLIKKMNLQNNVKLKGYTTDSSYIYKTAACSILTSDSEGFGMVLTESLATGTPVISYDTKYGPSDIIRDGENGYLVKKGDKIELADKIINIMENTAIRKKMSQNALEVNERFSVEKYTENWISLLTNI